MKLVPPLEKSINTYTFCNLSVPICAHYSSFCYRFSPKEQNQKPASIQLFIVHDWLYCVVSSPPTHTCPPTLCSEQFLMPENLGVKKKLLGVYLLQVRKFFRHIQQTEITGIISSTALTPLQILRHSVNLTKIFWHKP